MSNRVYEFVCRKSYEDNDVKLSKKQRFWAKVKPFVATIDNCGEISFVEYFDVIVCDKNGKELGQLKVPAENVQFATDDTKEEV
jgi:hypothetical protein